MSAVRSPCLTSARERLQPLGPRGAQEIAAEHVEHGVALIASVERDSGRDEHQRRQHKMSGAVYEPFSRPEVEARSDFSGRVQQLGVAGKTERVVQPDAGILVEDRDDHHRCRQDDKRKYGDEVIHGTMLLDGAEGAGGDAERGADEHAEQDQPQAHPHAAVNLFAHRRVVDGSPEIAADDPAGPAGISLGERRSVVHVQLIEDRVDDLWGRRRIASFVAGPRVQLGRCQHVGNRCGDDDEQNRIDKPAKEEPRHQTF